MFECFRKEKKYIICQVKQDSKFNKETLKLERIGEPYTEIIAHGKTKKNLRDFCDIAWDLCNIACWSKELKNFNDFREPITKNNIDFIYPVFETFDGIVNSDIIIYDENKLNEYYVTDLFGWKKMNSKKDAEKYIISRCPIFSF